uniref:Acyltransferase n=1 Tax=Cyclopterus lumpus TaxID=8103 RepID=A0A8C3AFZ1_CYCLU
HECVHLVYLFSSERPGVVYLQCLADIPPQSSPTCILLFLYLLFTRFWLVSVLYAVWWFFDYDTPARGGRRVSMVCELKMWKYMRDYFPIKLVKTADLDPRHNYILGFHPHGVLVAGAFTNFCTYTTGFRQLFPGLTSYLLMLPLWFRAPFFRDYIMCAGLIPSDKKSASYPLSKKRGGNAVVIAVGGAPEALDAHPGTYTLLLAKKKGFIKMAMDAHLVPVFSFGENELFDQVGNQKGTWLRWLQERLQRIMGISLPLFHARGIFQYSFGLLPYRKPISTVGECINQAPGTTSAIFIYACVFHKLQLILAKACNVTKLAKSDTSLIELRFLDKRHPTILQTLKFTDCVCVCVCMCVCVCVFYFTLQSGGQLGWKGMRNHRLRNLMPSTSCTWTSSAICLRSTKATTEWIRTHN